MKALLGLFPLVLLTLGACQASGAQGPVDACLTRYAPAFAPFEINDRQTFDLADEATDGRFDLAFELRFEGSEAAAVALREWKKPGVRSHLFTFSDDRESKIIVRRSGVPIDEARNEIDRICRLSTENLRLTGLKLTAGASSRAIGESLE